MVTSLPTSYPCLVRAIYSWSGEEKRDLGFVEGDIIEVLNTGDGNWWMGKLKRNKMVGSFPCNFVEFIEDKKSTPSPEPTTAHTPSRSVSPAPPQFTPVQQQQQQHLTPITHRYSEFERTDSTTSRPRSEILDDIASQLNSTYRPAKGFDYDSGGSDEEIRREYDYSDEDYERSDEDLPPPVPPPHSSQYRHSSGSTIQARRTNLDRTPSPLRHAMNDVMASLEGMDFSTTGSNSRSDDTAVNDENDMRYPLPRLPEKRSSVTTVTGSEELKYAQPIPQHFPPERSSSFVMNNYLEQQQGRRDSDEDEGYIPFDPSSYNSVSRHGTYQSISSLKSGSVRSNSTTPTTYSNISATSAGSLIRRKQDSLYRSSPTPGISEPHTVTEVPVKLPNAKGSDSKSAKGLRLQKSATFLKKLFTSSDKDDSKSVSELGRSRSIKSFRSSRSARSKFSIGSSSIKNGVRKLGKMTGISSDLYASKSSTDLGGTWIETRRDVHRANSITSNEREQRRKRQEMQGIAPIEPIKCLSLVKGNETLNGFTRGEGKLDLRSQDFTHVDAAIFAMHTWPQLMSPSVFASSRIGREFQYDTDRLRAVFDFCASKIAIESYDDYSDDDDENESEVTMSFSRLMQSRQATVQELAECIKSMCESLEIHCEVVRGRLKGPGELVDRASVPRANHYWNAVLINDEWRMIDAALASPSFPTRDLYYKCDEGSNVNHFYFLTPPTELIYSHVPLDELDQHLVPPLESAEALALPLAGPAAFEHQIKLLDYKNVDCRLENYEVAELNFSVPHGVQLSCQVLCGQDHSMPGLAQVYWENNRRYCRVKAMLPEPFSQGVLQVYVSEQGQAMNMSVSTSTRGSLALAYSVGITHNGQNAPFEFVTRHPTPHCKRQDAYVAQPQCKKLNGGNSYVFQVRQHPANGITAGSGFSRTKLGIQSPSGKITKLHRKGGSEDGLVFGVWDATIKTMEVGTWRGLVLADRGNAWSVFAEWYCI